MVDIDGWLAIGKFPSVEDARSVTRGEVLALKLAEKAGIDVSPARKPRLGRKPLTSAWGFGLNEAQCERPA